MEYNAIENKFCPTLQELLQLSIFENCKVCSGAQGLNNVVCGVNMTDAPDYDQWIGKNELLVTTCYSLRGDEKEIEAFIPRLASCGVAGVCIKPTRFLGAMPDSMLKAAGQLGVPLIELPPETRFADIAAAVSDEILRRQTSVLTRSLSLNNMLIQMITEGASLKELTGMISDILKGSILIVDSVNNRQIYHLLEADACCLKGCSDLEIREFLSRESEVYDLSVGLNFYGHLYLYRADPADNIDETMTSQILQAVALEIAREHTMQKAESRHLIDYFMHLLSDGHLDESSEQSRALSYGIDLSASHMLIRGKVRQVDNGGKYSETFRLTAFFHDLDILAENHDLIIRRMKISDEYIIWISERETAWDDSTIMNEIAGMVDRLLLVHPMLRITAGCSQPHAGLSGFLRCDREASTAYQAACEKGDCFLRFDQLGILRLIYSDDPKAETDRYLSDTLKELCDPNYVHCQDLMNTLRSYFNTFGNQRAMAKELYIHYNTVVYRIRQIQEITGKNLRNMTDRIQLEMALALYDFREAAGHSVFKT